MVGASRAGTIPEVSSTAVDALEEMFTGLAPEEQVSYADWVCEAAATPAVTVVVALRAGARRTAVGESPAPPRRRLQPGDAVTHQINRVPRREAQRRQQIVDGAREDVVGLQPGVDQLGNGLEPTR